MLARGIRPSLLAERGLGHGDRLGMGLRNSPQFVMSALAAWKLGAVPVPMRWDVPEWEFERLREVIDGTVFLGEQELALGMTRHVLRRRRVDVSGPLTGDHSELESIPSARRRL